MPMFEQYEKYGLIFLPDSELQDYSGGFLRIFGQILPIWLTIGQLLLKYI